MSDPPEARERGDWRSIREAGNLGQAAMAALVPPVTGIKTATYFATAPDGARIELRWYTTGETTAPGPAVLYAHGGGMILGDLDATPRAWPPRAPPLNCTSIPAFRTDGTASPPTPGPPDGPSPTASAPWRPSKWPTSRRKPPMSSADDRPWAGDLPSGEISSRGWVLHLP